MTGAGAASPGRTGRVRVELATPADTQGFGRRLAGLLRAGDLVVLSGGLGAGKTTLTQGIGAGLGVAGDITSPTFVIAREHRGPRTDLVHVDAYRLGSLAEVDDLDLDVSVEEAVTVVEWGEGRVEALAAGRLLVHLDRDRDGDRRTATVRGVGGRWDEVDLGVLLDRPDDGGAWTRTDRRREG